MRSDHPSNKKCGGVCIYYKSYLPLRIIDINYLNKGLRFKLMVGDKLCNFIALYRSPSKSQYQFESFKDNLQLNLESAMQNNPFLVVLLGDFNVKSSNWYKNDITTSEGKAIENITSQFALHQEIDETTHILESSFSCIDLIFTSQQNLITESGVHPSIRPNSHHQIIFAKINLENISPPPYLCDVWHYQDVNNATILNILSNSISHETVTVEDNDPFWSTKIKIKNLIQEKNNVYKSYRNSKSNKNIEYLRRLKLLQENVHNETEVSKSNYYSRITNKLTNI